MSLDQLTPATTVRTCIYTATGRDAPKLVQAELARLEAAYLKAHKRKIPAEVLHVSGWSEDERPYVGITAYTTPEQDAIRAFLVADATTDQRTAA